MFGPKIKINDDKMSIILRPPKREEMAAVGEGFSSFKVMKYISAGARPIEDRQKWYDAHIDRFNGLKNDIVWGIEPVGNKELVGIASIFDIKEHISAVSGTTIFDQKWWNKGISSLVHLARTVFAFDQLNLNILYGSVTGDNKANVKVIERFGYLYTGKKLRADFVDGRYADELYYALVNPSKVDLLYNCEDIPEDVKASVDAVKKQLEKARKMVEYL